MVASFPGRARAGVGRRAAGWLARIAVLGLCVGYALWDVDLGALSTAIARYRADRLALVFALTWVSYAGLAGRLARLLRDVPETPSTPTVLVASLFALGMNNLLPARLGELAKVAYLHRHGGASTGRLMGAVFWERFADVHALLVLSIVLVASLGRTEALVPMATLVTVGWVLLAWLRHRPRPFRAVVGRLPGAALRRLGHDAIDHLRERIGPRLGVELALWTIAIWLLYFLHVHLVLTWVAQLQLSPVQTLAVFLGLSLGAAVPISPGALGVYEAVVVLVLGWYGVPPGAALAAGLTAHMLQYVPTTTVAAVVLARTGVSWRTVRPSRTVKPGR